MAAKNTDALTLNANGANILRIIIASYFLAVAARLIPGTDVSALFATVLPEPLSYHVASATVFGLAFLVLVGVWLRGAALLLAIIFFWSSFLSVSTIGLAESLGGFWRDLALMAALIMTYAESGPRNRARRGIFRVVPSPREAWPVRPRRVDATAFDVNVAQLDRSAANLEAAKSGSTAANDVAGEAPARSRAS